MFISYSSKDEKEVNKIVEIMNQSGIKYWKAPEMIPIGSNYAREIPKAIKGCQVFLLVISKTSQESIWVEKEIDCAINFRKTILPIKIADIELTDMFKFYLNNVQTMYFLNDEFNSLCALRDRILYLLGDSNGKDLRPQTNFDELERKRMLTQSLAFAYNKQGSVKQTKINQKRSYALSLNPQPLCCQYCEGDLEYVSRGVYRCISCGAENYDYYNIVRNYLDKSGPRPIDVIERETGVPRKSIDYFLKQEMLEIPKACAIRISCQRCGAPIRSGSLCDSCKMAKKSGKI